VTTTWESEASGRCRDVVTTPSPPAATTSKIIGTSESFDAPCSSKIRYSNDGQPPSGPQNIIASTEPDRAQPILPKFTVGREAQVPVFLDVLYSRHHAVLCSAPIPSEIPALQQLLCVQLWSGNCIRCESEPWHFSDTSTSKHPYVAFPISPHRGKVFHPQAGGSDVDLVSHHHHLLFFLVTMEPNENTADSCSAITRRHKAPVAKEKWQKALYRSFSKLPLPAYRPSRGLRMLCFQMFHRHVFPFKRLWNPIRNPAQVIEGEKIHFYLFTRVHRLFLPWTEKKMSRL